MPSGEHIGRYQTAMGLYAYCLGETGLNVLECQLEAARNKVGPGVFMDPWEHFDVDPVWRDVRDKKNRDLVLDDIFNFFVDLNGLMLEERVVQLERMTAEQLAYYDKDGERVRRQTAAVIVNGDIGAGKGTTMLILGLHPIESGTDGFGGHGKGYESWEYITRPFDAPRFGQKLFPDKFLRIWFNEALRDRRAKLDAEGKFETPVVISGAPRTVDQTKMLAGLDGDQIRSVYLTIEPETAVRRTVSRISDAILQGQNPREDDFASLTIDSLTVQDSEIVRGSILVAIRAAMESGCGSTKDVIKTLDDAKTLGLWKMHPNSRYEKMRDTKDAIIAAMRDGVQVGSTVIPCDGKTMDQVAEETRMALKL